MSVYILARVLPRDGFVHIFTAFILFEFPAWRCFFSYFVLSAMLICVWIGLNAEYIIPLAHELAATKATLCVIRELIHRLSTKDAIRSHSHRRFKPQSQTYIWRVSIIRFRIAIIIIIMDRAGTVVAQLLFIYLLFLFYELHSYDSCFVNCTMTLTLIVST